MKKRILAFILVFVMVSALLVSCATAAPVPYNATKEQIEEINAKNIEAVAKNTSTLAGIQIASLITGFIVGLMIPAY